MSPNHQKFNFLFLTKLQQIILTITVITVSNVGKKKAKTEEKFVTLREGDLAGLLLRMLGGDWIEVYCSDGLIRKVRIPRSKRYIRVRPNDIIIVRPWYGIDESRADMVNKLTPRDIKHLLKTEHADKIKKVLTEELKELYGIEE